MQMTSVNIAEPQTMQYAKESALTGIFKVPAAGAVRVGELGLMGDYIDDKKNHGGPDQAVYIYGGGDYAWWEGQIGRPLTPGIFGENITVSDLESAEVCIGDRFHIGGVILEAAAARVPCVTLATRMDDPQFVKKFRAAERPGIYCRVLQTGEIRMGDAVRIEPYAGAVRLTIREMFQSWYDKDTEADDLRRQLAAPIAVRSRRVVEERLAAMSGE
ncbi:MAG: MOSC domain-containing protein [Chloroflexota bacterium]|nr:MOSC domain-containing protein [Chloroflexota bacterium]